MKQETMTYAGLECIKLENANIALWLTISAGPRIIGLTLNGGDNLLAVLPGEVEKTPGGATYTLRGGHRLWHAPEHPERTYVPDDAPLAVSPVAGGVCVSQPVENSTGIEKRMTVTLPDNRPRAVIDHMLVNRGVWPVTLAPWAITQLRPGGFAILPQPTTATGMLPNRRLALWPYTDVNSPHIQWGNDFLFVHATMTENRLKMGWANPDGWLGYWLEDTLFVKAAAYQPPADYFDFGSSSECYCDARFIELETLGPKITLAPEEKVTHREVWSVYPNVPLTADEAVVSEWVDRLQIGR